MNCPKCHGATEQVTYAGVEVDRCTACGGLWFDVGEHERLKGVPGAEKIDTGAASRGAQQNEAGDIDCPHCAARMVKMVDHAQPHIWYEMCSTCGGVYFDAGEFTDFKQQTVGDFFKRLGAKRRY